VIRAEDQDGLRLIWLDRPAKRNALTLAMVEALRDELRRAAADHGIRGVIVAGAGPSTCAGVDLHEFAEGTPGSIRRLITVLAEACAAARRCPRAIVMAIRGHCLGAALELACACDFRVAESGAQLGMPEVQLGIPSVIDAALLERHVGVSRARELILTADPITAEQALGWGLLNLVVPTGKLIDASRGMLERVARHHPAAIARQKRLFADWQNLSLDDAIESSKDALVDSFASGVPQRLARELL
jgi:enoyl-CoA hydratase/carnithine racemase